MPASAGIVNPLLSSGSSNSAKGSPTIQPMGCIKQLLGIVGNDPLCSLDQCTTSPEHQEYEIPPSQAMQQQGKAGFKLGPGLSLFGHPITYLGKIRFSMCYRDQHPCTTHLSMSVNLKNRILVENRKNIAKGDYLTLNLYGCL